MAKTIILKRTNEELYYLVKGYNGEYEYQVFGNLTDLCQSNFVWTMPLSVDFFDEKIIIFESEKYLNKHNIEHELRKKHLEYFL